MWFTGVYAVSDGVKCYPTPYRINSYNVISPVKDLKVNLRLPSTGRVVIAAYQVSIHLSSNGWFTARLHRNNEQLTSTTMTQGYDTYFSLNSLWMKYQKFAEYEFGVTYRTPYSNTYFADCRENYQGNKNLYAMYLPRGLVNLRLTSLLSLSTTSWRLTDLSYTFTLSRNEHVFARYQYGSTVTTTYIFTRLVIDSVPMKHTDSIIGNEYYHGNSGMWQGVLSSGRHTIAVQHRGGCTYSFSNNADNTRTMDIISCY